MPVVTIFLPLSHVTEMTQPLGHSSSGSHERYKSQERLAWETEFDPLLQMWLWLLNEELMRESELAALEQQIRQEVKTICEQAWQALVRPLQRAAHDLADLLTQAAHTSLHEETLHRLAEALRTTERPTRKHLLQTARSALLQLRQEANPVRTQLAAWFYKAITSFPGTRMTWWQGLYQMPGGVARTYALGHR